MSLIPWRNNKNLVSSLKTEVDTLFDNFFSGNFGEVDSSVSSPRINIEETKSNYLITAELPGLSEKDIDVSIEDNILTFKGESEKEEKTEKKNYIYMERSYDSFARSIQLPENILQDKIVASFKNGILAIELPKKEIDKTSKAKKIDIKT